MKDFKNSKILLASVLSLGLFSAYACAEQPAYSYLEGGFSRIDPGNVDRFDPFDGYVLRGSVDISENIYVAGSYTDTSNDTRFGDYKLSKIYAGAGFKAPIADSTSFFTELSYVYADAEFDGAGDFRLVSVSNSEDGFEIKGGIRSMLGENTEVNVSLAHTDLVDASTTLGIGLRQYFSESFGIFADVSRDDFESNFYNVGASFRF